MVEQLKVYIKFILRDGYIHSSQDSPIAAFVYEFDTQQIIYHNFFHLDVIQNSTLESFKQYLVGKRIYVINKKRYKYQLPNIDLYDVNLFRFLKDGNVVEPPHHTFTTNLHMMHHRINETGLITPYVIHQSEFESEVELIKECVDQNTDTYCYKFFNNVVTDTLFEVEKNGLSVDVSKFKSYFKNAKIKDGFVYSEYNIYNPTGRPSNKFDCINYVALNKEDGCRASFISRYKTGKLLMIDFTGFHPYIVANLVGYKVPDNETIYEHLAKQYYNVDSVSKDLLGKSKKLTMVNLYGQISKKYINIPYFQLVETLKDKYWAEFTQNGHVKTPIYKRKITTNHVVEPNKNKLFAYIIQATETEYGINSLSNCIKYVIGKNIKPILYIYDSILFDVSGDVSQSEIDDLINIIRGKRFKVKVYIGNTYNDLKLV